MRHAILVLPTLLFLACSSGGEGKPTVGTPGGFGVEGSSIPVFGGDQTGGDQTGGGTPDTGTIEGQTDAAHGGKDTGNTVVDTSTGGTGDDAICAAKCPEDVATSPSVIKTCKDTMSGATCPSQYRAYWVCLANNRVCTDTGTTDTAATQAACKTEADAINTCATG